MQRVHEKVYVVGVGMTKFDKPGKKEGDYPDWSHQAVTAALDDAGLAFAQVESAFAGYVYGESTAGQRALYTLGTGGIPIVNVNNNCATGSTSLYLARQAVRFGAADCVLALGFEKMERGSLAARYEDRTNPLDRHLAHMHDLRGPEGHPYAVEMFGNAGRDHMERFGSKPRHFAWIGWKNHHHSVNNPFAQFQVDYSLEEIERSPMIHEPLTKLQCSPTSDGAAAAVLASESFVEEHGVWDRAVQIAGQTMITDFASSFAGDCMSVVGADMSRAAAEATYREAEATAAEVDVCELHDCFSANELITYEALGFAGEGEAHALVDAEATTFGGSGPVVNPSGGLISKGHPLGATGLAQCAELTWQLREESGMRQVNGATTALQHNIGLGGAAVVTLYRRPVR